MLGERELVMLDLNMLDKAVLSKLGKNMITKRCRGKCWLQFDMMCWSRLNEAVRTGKDCTGKCSVKQGRISAYKR